MKAFAAAALLLLAGCATELYPGPTVALKNPTNPKPLPFENTAEFEALKPLLVPYSLPPDIIEQLDPAFVASLEYR